MGSKRRLELDEAAPMTRREQLGAMDRPKNPFVDFAQQVGGSVLDIVDFAGKLSPNAGASEESIASMRSGGEPIQSPSLRSRAGIPERTDTYAGRAGTLAVESALTAIPLGRAATTVARAPAEAGKVRTFLQNSINAMGNRFRSAPKATVVAEGVAGAAAGAAGVYASDRFPDSDAAQLVGEIIGGSAPGGVVPAITGTGKVALKGADYVLSLAEKLPTMRVIGAGIRTAAESGASTISAAAQRANTPSGTRSSQRIDRATDDRIGAARAMDDDLAFGDMLTPAQLTGDAGILSMEKSLIESGDKLKNKSIAQIGDVNDALKQSLQRTLGQGGDPNATAASFEETIEYHRFLMKERVKTATALADEAVATIVPDNFTGIGPRRSPREAANVIARREISSALSDATRQESILYDAIDQEAILPLNNGREAAADAVKRAGTARSGDVSVVVRNQLLPTGKDFAPMETVAEVRNMQGKLREEARIARADGNFNKARMADDVADSLTKDIEALPDGGESVRLAVAYSKVKSETFRQGTVGKILGYVDTGEGRIPEGMTLESALGSGGPRGREGIDDIMTATSTPEVKEALDVYIRKDFMQSAIREGVLNRDAAVNYLARNEEMLNRVPEIKRRIQAAIDADSAVLFKQNIQSRINYQKSSATLFIRDDPKKAFETLLGPEVRNPRNEMRKLINMAEKDKTGEALLGLKASFSDYLIGAVTDHGFISGRKLNDIIINPKTRGAMETLYTDAEMLAVNRINNTALRMDAARSAERSVEGVMEDKIPKTLDVLARVIGAATGREVASLTGGGTIQVPAVMANRFSELVKNGVNNPARELLISSLNDPELMKIMLTVPMNQQYTKQQTQRLNAWAVAVLLDNGLDSKEEER